MDKCELDLFWQWLKKSQFCDGFPDNGCLGCQNIYEHFLACPRECLGRFLDYHSLQELFPAYHEEAQRRADRNP